MILAPKKEKGKNFRKKHRNSHAREVAMQALYQMEVVQAPLDDVLLFGWLNQPLDTATKEFCVNLVRGVAENAPALDDVIISVSNKDMTQISMVIRSVIRIGMFELMRGELDPNIVMDDLLNLARKYDGEESVAFVNGILDRFEKERKSLRQN